MILLHRGIKTKQCHQMETRGLRHVQVQCKVLVRTEEGNLHCLKILLEGENLYMKEHLHLNKQKFNLEGLCYQRSLPNYSGRGWHESRKQVINEFGGLKKSYYMDPQPLNHFEWHLYEYEIRKCDVCALYRLELKLVDGKKNSKAKVANDSVVDLHKQMVKLPAEFPPDNKSWHGRCLSSNTQSDPSKWNIQIRVSCTI
ncbi:unnamed protein product [Lathyrus oleraceus]